MMKNAKMNEKGKLLAIIAVFAMVFAGAAVVMSSEGVDAADPTSYEATPVPATEALPDSITSSTTVPAGGYYVSSNTTTTLSNAALAINVYVKSGVTVTFKGADNNDGVSIAVIGYYEAADAAKTKMYNAKAASGDYAAAVDTNIDVADLAAGETIAITPTTVAGKNTTMQISGTATTTANLLTINLGNVVVSADTGTPAVTVKGTLTLKGNAAPANLTYAYSLYKATPGTIAINEKPLKTYNHAADTDTADVLTIAGYEGLKVTADIKVTSDKGATTFKLEDTPLTADLIVSMKKTTEPAIAGGTAAVENDPDTEEDESVPATVVTLFQGYATAKAASEADGFKGTLNAVQKSGAATEYYAQIYYKAGDSTVTPAVPDQKYTKVVGTVTQKSTINLVAAAGAITVEAGNTLIIPAGVEVIVNEASTLAGSVELYGALVDKAAVPATSKFTPGANDSVKIGPYGYTNFTCTDATKVSNVSSNGEQPDIGSVIFEKTEIGSAILHGNMIIREGGTLIANNDFGLNGYTITVYGTLIIKGSLFTTALDENGVTTGKNVLTIGSTGKVDIQGEIGVNTFVGIILDSETNHVDLKLRGVDGLVYSPVEYENTTVPAISGEIVPNNASYKDVKATVILGDDKTLIPLPLVISSGVTLNVAKNEGELVAGGLAAISLEGTLKGAQDSTLILNSLSSIAINGIVDTIAIKAYQGDIAATTTDPNTTFAFTIGKTKGDTGATPAVPSKKTYVAGLTITVAPFVVSKTLTEQRIYIDGELTVGTSTENADATVTTAEAPRVTLTGANADVDMIYIEEDDKLTLPANDTLVFGATGLTFVVEGVIEKTTNELGSPYIGGHYVLKTAVQSATITTHVYENYAKAIAVIGSTDGKTVDLCVKEIGSGFTIVEGEKVNLLRTDTVIKSDATVTFESNSSMTGTVDTVHGILKVMNGARVNEPTHYTSMIITETDDVIYAGADGANEIVQPGSEIIMGDGEAKGDFTFKAGVKYRLQGTLQIPGNVSVEEGSNVVFEGGEIKFKGDKTHNLQVAGNMDASQGTISKATDKDKITTSVTPTGKLTVISEEVIDELGFNGASYETMDGFVLTTIDSAIPGAIAAALDYIVKIHGNVVYVADITVEKVTIVFKTDATLSFAGTVTLDGATIDVTNGTFSGTVRASSALDSSTAEFTAAKGISIVSEKGALTLSGAINSGDIAIQFGTVYLDGFTMSGGATLLVEERATVSAKGTATVNGGTFRVLGNAEANNGGRLVLNAGEIVIVGNLIAAKGETSGTVEINRAKILGTMENKGGEFRLTGDPSETTGLIVGDEPGSLGAANGTVVGDITANGNAVLIYAGADFDEMTIDGIESGKLKMTVFCINNVPYMYLVSSSSVGITDDMLEAPKYDLPGYDVPSTIKTLAGWNLPTTATTGNPESVNFEVKKHPYPVMVSPIKGMSIIIDGITYSSNREAELFFGEHSISYRMDPGYKEASEIVLSFNGVTVKDKFTINPGIDESDLKITASGSIVIDQEIPEQQKQDDSIIIIMLAILVVMVVILAIVTILRMMRS